MTSPYSIADDHAFFRQHLKNILEEMEDLQVIGEAGNGLELLALLGNVNPDLILLDISMPKLSGIEVARQVKAISPRARVLIVTLNKSEEHFRAAVSAGTLT
jgi:two-component system nitrate/nitrite response regulator NarL